MAFVLLIEDDPAQRAMASFALTKAGHEVVEALDGHEGLAAARAQPPDLVVSDVMMPGMTGYEVVEALRADPDLVNTPILLLTAMSDRRHMRQGMTAGADDYLTKPYKPAELCEAVDALLARKHNQQQAFMNSVSEVVTDALEEQKEFLARKYEGQLVREVSARWERKADEAGDVSYPHALLLLVDVVGAAAEPGIEKGLAELTRKAQQQARDTLYLFGATHVLPFGTELLGVFAGDEATLTISPEARLLRAAFALLKALPRERGVQLCLHAGPPALINVDDALHGERGQALVPGDTLAGLSAAREAGRLAGWRITASQDVAAGLTNHASLGRTAVTARGDEVVELRPLRSG